MSSSHESDSERIRRPLNDEVAMPLTRSCWGITVLASCCLGSTPAFSQGPMSSRSECQNPVSAMPRADTGPTTTRVETKRFVEFLPRTLTTSRGVLALGVAVPTDDSLAVPISDSLLRVRPEVYDKDIVAEVIVDGGRRVRAINLRFPANTRFDATLAVFARHFQQAPKVGRVGLGGLVRTACWADGSTTVELLEYSQGFDVRIEVWHRDRAR